MPPQDWIKIISIAVVPVVIISACGLLCLAFYNRLAAIVSRLRGFQRERLHEQEKMDDVAPGDDAEAELRRGMLNLLETQTLRVTRRAKLIRLTLLFLLLAISLLISCCMILGLSVMIPEAVGIAVPLFMLGLLSMLVAMICAMLELRGALQPAELESRFVTGIIHHEHSQGIDAV
jgi:hypothetical protein